MRVVSSRDEDRPALVAFLRENNALVVARRGELVDASEHPAVVAWSGDELVGVATYLIDGAECELLTLYTRTRHDGTGSALVEALRDIARRSGCSRLWVVTTNDNVDALRFYQRRGFQLTHLRAGAVDESRETLKPEIPTTGAYGIPLRDELELETDLSGDAAGAITVGP